MGWLSLCPSTSFALEAKIKLPSLAPRTPSDIKAAADPNAPDRRSLPAEGDAPAPPPPLAPATSHTTAAALALLRDYPAMIALNPLVQSYELLRDPHDHALGLPAAPDDDDGSRPVEREVYRITDAIPVAMLGRTWWTGSTTYVAGFAAGARHVETRTRAQWGVSTSAVWRVKTTVAGAGEGEGEGEDKEVVELTESVTVRLPFFLRPFVAATVRRAHAELREAFVERLRHLEEMKVRRMEREKEKAMLEEGKEVGGEDGTAKQDEEKEERAAEGG